MIRVASYGAVAEITGGVIYISGVRARFEREV